MAFGTCYFIEPLLENKGKRIKPKKGTFYFIESVEPVFELPGVHSTIKNPPIAPNGRQ